MARIFERFKQSILSKFFKLLYHQFAFSYDLVSSLVSLGLWKSWVYAVHVFLPGPRILEIGHGPGHLLKSLSERGSWVVGIDASWPMQQVAKKNLSSSAVWAHLVHGLAQYLPYKNNVFDQVVSTFPSNYIVDPLTLSEIYRVLVPEGKMVVIPVAWITGKKWWYRLAAWLFRITDQVPYNDTGFEQKWSRLFVGAGFQVRVHYTNLGSSSIFILVAKKPLTQ